MFSKRPSHEQEHIVSEIERLLPAFRSFAIGLTGDRFAADDLVQASCERALGRLDQVTDISGVGSWVNRIIYTQWQDRLRKRKSRRAKLISFGQYRSNQLQSVHAGDSRAITKLDIGRALDLLSEDHRAVLALVVFAGHNYQEAAMILDIPLGTVASRVARAKATLAEFLLPTSERSDENRRIGRLSDEYER
jgi:RNA polymerase sigma-70 factor (ECF subfamily)